MNQQRLIKIYIGSSISVAVLTLLAFLVRKSAGLLLTYCSIYVGLLVVALVLAFNPMYRKSSLIVIVVVLLLSFIAGIVTSMQWMR